MASAHGRLGQHFLAVLDVVLRVPSIFIIDAILNSYSDPGTGWSGAAGRALIRALGIVVSGVVLVLSQKSLFKFYTLFMAVLLGAASVLVNYYATAHADFYSAYNSAAVLPRDGPTLWLALALMQLLLGLGYVALLRVRSVCAALLLLDIMAPLWGLILELPADMKQVLAIASGVILATHAALNLLLKLKWFYYSCRYVYLLLRHMYRIYGLQLLLEDTWKRIRFPDILRVFWLTRVTAQAVILLYVVRVVRSESGMQLGWDVLWDLSSNLIISGCDSTLTVLGMSAVISSLAHYLGLSILAFIGSTEEEDKRLGFVAPVLFFILALQTGLSGLDPEERLVRLSRNMCLLLTAILHFIHGMTDPVLMSLSASHVSSVRRHVPVLLVSLVLFTLPVLLSFLLWHHYALNTWLFAVTAFCIELCLKVLVSLTVYALFMMDGFYNVLWEKLDDYVYYVRSTGNVIEFIFGVIMFGNGAYTMMFESGSKIRACMMCLHAYFNIYLQAKNGWKTFINRRTAVKKINSLPEVRGSRLRDIEDVCAICYQEFGSSARITPCSHYFHALCLRKWLYIQDTCPMCHQRVYIEDDTSERSTFSNNNGYGAAGQERAEFEENEGGAEDGVAAAGAEPENELLEDNDSIEYDEEEWGTQPGVTLIEEDYINDDTDSN
ncbi:E3 ubiquitin-protein ligase RNF139 isoform X1 [Danio rerio]|uniref:E3 ubiquitin-protein ligase RNF139 n=1 Tax=Danio rerio TaxID=7955 RepID=B1H1M0_DANRE|nr:E3 ubiquitin-protein ligase RNF139 [Danio rerio]XP_005173774.1 E3 ubiquitin-protein ligase RNF139 isoform X1 [Danio rerio]AAI60659.1 Zgc:175173 protein [Danio rerio]|eukprot:NP_001116520.1 E3 ubiquitin-protein ligase RNF139 [Danio rerio]